MGWVTLQRIATNKSAPGGPSDSAKAAADPHMAASDQAVKMPKSSVSASLQQALAVLILVDIAPQARWWGYARFVIGRYAMRKLPGLRFFKILGSGYQGGFGLQPSASIQGLFCVFEDQSSADAFLGASPLAAAYRQRAREFFSVKLHPFASRGSWSAIAGQRSDATSRSGRDSHACLDPAVFGKIVLEQGARRAGRSAKRQRLPAGCGSGRGALAAASHLQHMGRHCIG
jgi:hypothetical protein